MGIRFRAGETEFEHAAARVISDAHLTWNGKRIFAVADYGPGEALIFATPREGRIFAPDHRRDENIGRLRILAGEKLDVGLRGDVPDTVWEGIVQALERAGAFDPAR